MLESSRNLEKWRSGDILAAMRFQAMQELAQAALLTGVGKGMRMYRGAQSGTVISVDRPYIPPNTQVVVQIGLPEAGGGKYQGIILGPPNVDIPASGDLTADEIGDSLNGTPCRVINTREEGLSTHDLYPTFLPHSFLGKITSIAEDGVPIVTIDGFQWKNCELGLVI